MADKTYNADEDVEYFKQFIIDRLLGSADDNTYAFKEGDVVKSLVEQDGRINVGDIGVIKRVRKNVPWPYYVDYGKGGITEEYAGKGSEFNGLAPMSEREIELHVA